MTTASLIDGKTIAQLVRTDTAQRVAEFTTRTGRRPGLATILVGGDPASHVYVGSKRKACVAAGMEDHHRELPETASQDDIARVIDELAEDPRVSGILLQLPLPAGLDAEPLIERIPPAKDVDGLTTISAGLLAQGKPGLRPCTPLGVIELLDQSGVEISGKHVVVIGRSALVGRPVAQLLTQRNATVTVVHSRSKNVDKLTATADIVVAAAGVPKLVTGSAVAPGAVVIDVGIHRVDGRLVGDVDQDSVEAVASALTPVPGGVGPMTIAMLLRNTLQAAEAQSAIK
jgi:methylenetetrahydrofolate dehydrogenase (NADP+)/methenyltetrahydrofolate cyclohydrolase